MSSVEISRSVGTSTRVGCVDCKVHSIAKSHSYNKQNRMYLTNFVKYLTKCAIAMCYTVFARKSPVETVFVDACYGGCTSAMPKSAFSSGVGITQLVSVDAVFMIEAGVLNALNLRKEWINIGF